MGQEQGAVEPEPGDTEDRQEDQAIGASVADHPPGLEQGIGLQAQLRIRWRCRGDEATGGIAGHRDDQRRASDPDGVAGRRQESAEQGADQDRDKRAGLDQGIAADQLVGLQMLGQDGVLDRTEQRRVAAEQTEGDQQQRQAVAGETGAGDDDDDDLENLHQTGDARLVELVGELAGAGGEDEERQDEDSRRQVGQNAR